MLEARHGGFYGKVMLMLIVILKWYISSAINRPIRIGWWFQIGLFIVSRTQKYVCVHLIVSQEQSP